VGAAGTRIAAVVRASVGVIAVGPFMYAARVQARVYRALVSVAAILIASAVRIEHASGCRIAAIDRAVVSVVTRDVGVLAAT
jgi:hypothetical protein